MMSRRPLGLLTLSSALALTGCPESEPVCADCFDHNGYEIDFSSVPDDTKPPAAVLFSGWRNGRCQDDEVCTGTPDVFLGDVRWGDVQWSRDCDPQNQEVIAFAGGYQPFVATPKVPAGTGVRLDGTVVLVDFQPPLPIDVKLWVVAHPATDATQAGARVQAAALLAPNGQAVTARRVFADFGGINLRITSAAFPSQTFDPEKLYLLYYSASCDQITDITSLGAAGYDAAQLNVYYVDWLQNGRAGLNCRGLGPGGSGENIMFVQANQAWSAIQLAHELGHALGLARSTTVPGGLNPTAGASGHVDETYLDRYLKGNNLMHSGAHEVGQVTLGQIYRMHYDELSWKWTQPFAPLRGDDYPRECQDSPVAGGPCPPLTLNPANGW